jgi:hypothetical protein
MLYISYRGLLKGQNPQAENTPNQIGQAFNAGFACMVDAWRVNDKIYLGSDTPLNEVTAAYLKGNKFWINARNNDMLTWLQAQPANFYPNYFSLPEPVVSYVTTSSNYLWTFAETPINNTSIMVLPEDYDSGLFSTVNVKAYGICSMFIPTVKRMRNDGLSIYGPFY